jgi:uncharacterized protein YukE
MSAGFAVEVADLRGYADLVGRAGTDMSRVAGYAESNVTDGDFGRILEVITGDYEALIPTFHSVLRADGDRLGRVSTALDATRRTYVDADARAAQGFGIGRAIADDGSADGFGDMARVGSIPAPSLAGVVLPEVSFGFVLDKVCDLIVWVGGPDPREHVTRWIAGDIDKASLQASAWEHASDCVKSAEKNLTHGRGQILATWTGDAATASAATVEKWIASLGDQSQGMRSMSGHLRDMVVQAVDMAQVVVDIIKTVISIVSAALSSAYIPGWGQWKAIKTVKEAITLVNNARKVISAFWNALTMIKDYIVSLVHSFSITDLPPAPTAP